MPSIACPRLFASAVFLAALLGAAPSRAADPYRLQAGDSIDFTLLGTPPMSRRIMIGQDGEISIPLGGSFPAAGRTVEDLRQTVADRLKTVSYPVGVDAQGVTVWSVIYPESVLVEIGEYRPVYVSGDVLTPSAQAFRTGMTVAQAVAVAGGPSAYRGRQDHSLDRAGLGEEEVTAATAAAKAGLEVARIEAELRGLAAPDLSGIAVDGLDPELANRLRALELDRFTARREDLRKSRETILANIAAAEAQLGYLKRSQINLEDETRNYEDEVKRVEALLQKGLTPIDRLRAAQRGVLLVSTRSLDTLAAISDVERDLSDMKRSLAKLDDTARLENLAALQAASAQAAQAAARIEGLRLKARLVSGLGDDTQAIRYLVTRRDEDGPARRDVSADGLLQPGDLVEVELGEPSSGPAPDVPPMALLSPVAEVGPGGRDGTAALATRAEPSRIPTPTPAAR